jgi:PAS domain S-box-containing protein
MREPREPNGDSGPEATPEGNEFFIKTSAANQSTDVRAHGLSIGPHGSPHRNAITTRLLAEEGVKALLDESLATALDLAHAEMGSIRMLDESGFLRIAAHRGLNAPFLDFLVGRGHLCIDCEKVIEHRERIIVEDVSKDPVYEATPDLKEMLNAGARALQSTPLVARSGDLFGIISTLYPVPYCPDERDLRLLDLLARQVTDLLECAHAQAALRETEQQLRDVIDHTQALVWLKDLDGRFLRINRYMEKKLGLSSDQVIGRTVFDLFPQAEAQQFEANDRQVIQNGIPMEFEETLTQVGREFTYIATKFPLRDAFGRPRAVCAICTDVTKRKAAEARVQASEAQLRTVVENLTQGVVVSDLNGQLLHWNRSALEMHGFRSLEESRRHLPELVDTFELSDLDGTILPVNRWPLARILRGEELRGWEVLIRRIGTDWQRVFSYAGALVREATGQPLMAVVTVDDITERKRSEEVARQLQQDLSRAQAVAQTGSWRLDVRGNELHWSHETHRIFGIPLETALTYEAFLAAVHPDDRDHVDRSWKAALQGTPYDIEHRIIVDGQVKWIRERAELDFDGDGRLTAGFGTCQDITQRRTVEEKLRELTRTLEERVRTRTAEAEQRAAQLLRLNQELTDVEQKERRQLAELLHDGLQQLLVAAKLRATDARGRVPADQALHPVLDQINQLLRESIDVVRSLTLQLSPPALHRGGLIAALEWLAQLMYEKYHLQVRIEAANDAEVPPPDLCFLLFQAARELLFNVVKHAGIESAVVSVERRDQTLSLTVSDAGCGFQPSRLPALQLGESGSFGLHNVQQRLEFAGGQLKIESEPGRGTEVTVTVPLPAGS